MNILLCGVGGQGTVLASRILATAAMERGEFAVTAETIGMAQRGGCVVSHVRTGSEAQLFSPLLAPHTADLIIGFEPGETVRNIRYLAPGGTVIVADRAAYAVTTPDYDGNEALCWLKTQIRACYVISVEKLMMEIGNPKALNVALLGAAAAAGCVDRDAILAVLAKKVKPQYLDLNKKALEAGAGMVGKNE